MGRKLVKRGDLVIASDSHEASDPFDFIASEDDFYVQTPKKDRKRTSSKRRKALTEKSANDRIGKHAISSSKLPEKAAKEEVNEADKEVNSSTYDEDEETEYEDWFAIGAAALRGRGLRLKAEDAEQPQLHTSQALELENSTTQTTASSNANQDDVKGKKVIIVIDDEDDGNDEDLYGKNDEEQNYKEDGNANKSEEQDDEDADSDDYHAYNTEDERLKRINREKQEQKHARKLQITREWRAKLTPEQKAARSTRRREDYAAMTEEELAPEHVRRNVKYAQGGPSQEQKDKQNQRRREKRAAMGPEERDAQRELTREYFHTRNPVLQELAIERQRVRRADMPEEAKAKERFNARIRWHNLTIEQLGEYSTGLKNPLKTPESPIELIASCKLSTSIPPEAMPITNSSEGVSVIVCGRNSWKIEREQHDEMVEGNRIILEKFVKDFIAPTAVIGHESVTWHNRAAWQALPWVEANDNDDFVIPGEDQWNEHADSRFCQFFTSRPLNHNIFALTRGVDGASINPDSWMGLQNRFPTLNIILAFTCGELYARSRAPERHDFLYRTEPYDERVYCFFTVSELINHINGSFRQQKYEWLVTEWRVGRLARQTLSLAMQSGDRERLNQARADYARLRLYPRNGIPILI